jgi:tRNA threonylcarbamoyladenosine biosynthesis protein TsaE
MAINTLEINSPAEMQAWGRRFARQLKSGDVVALVGELGSGKTTLVQSIVAARGYKGGASSPTFALANEYRTSRGPIYHMDMYRLTAKELSVFPLEDYWGQGLCLIEWADRIRDRLPSKCYEVRLKITGPEQRSLKVVPGTTFSKTRK